MDISKVAGWNLPIPMARLIQTAASHTYLSYSDIPINPFLTQRLKDKPLRHFFLESQNFYFPLTGSPAMNYKSNAVCPHQLGYPAIICCILH